MKRRAYLYQTVFGAMLIAPVLAHAGAEFRLEPGMATATPKLSPALRDLAALQPPPRATAPIEMPRHLLPDFARNRTPAALPRLASPNVAVLDGATALPAGNLSGFTGNYDGANAKVIGGDLEPPDQGLAVNNGEIVEIINNSIQVFDSTGKPLSQPVANSTFFGSGSINLSDPHVVYDATVQRWFVEELEYGSSFTGFAVAVSQTSDPLGKYYLYQVNANTSKITGCGSSLCLPDYPQVGYDANGFYIAADLFSNGTGQFVNAGLYPLPKATLITGKPIKYGNFVLPEFVLQPSIPAPGQAFETGLNGTEYLMTARNIFDNSTNVRVYAVSNTNDIVTKPTSLVAHSVDVAAESYTSSVPSTQPDVVGPYGKSVGATSAPRLDGGYNAFGGGVKYAAGKLYGALTTGSTDSKGMARDVIAWFSVRPSVASGSLTAKIAAQGYITPATGYSVSYPGIALNKFGVGIIGASITNPNQKVVGGFPSTCFVKFTRNQTGTKLFVVGHGNTSDDGFTGYNGSSAVVGRWGDYAAGMVDPTTGSFYTANEFIPNAAQYPRGTYANWGTFITKLH